MPGITQFNPTIAVTTPLGLATAVALWTDDYDGVSWVCFQQDTGECWWWQNQDIRATPTVSGSSRGTSEIKLPAEREARLAPHRKRYPGGKP